MRPRAVLFLAALVLLIATRLCHSGILWADDTLPLAAAQQVALGKALFRDVWFDKPPLVAWVHLAWGARDGWPLRLGGALLAFAFSLLAYGAARVRFDHRAAAWSFSATAFFLTFYLPSAIIPTASDFLLLGAHLAAIGLSWRGRAFAAGVAAGIGLLCSSKALVVLAVCLLWQWRRAPLLLAGFALPQVLATAWFAAQGSLVDYHREAWEWGRIYAGDTFVANPATEFLKRTANWVGFHAPLLVAAAVALRRERDRRDWIWILLALAGVLLGLRFFPRYYFLLLAPFVILAGRGLAIASSRTRTAILLLALIPLVRFAPRYFVLASQALSGQPHRWADLALDQDSRDIARLLAGERGTLFVWGFRAEVYVLAPHLKPATRFLESQPISGVLADRHLFSNHVTAPAFLEPQLKELRESKPDIIVDGLGLLNPALSLERFLPLQDWMQPYERGPQTRYSILYRRLR